MTFIADLFAKLRTPKNVVRYMSKESRFKGPLTGNMVNAFKHCCDPKNVVRYMYKKSRFKQPFDRQHGKRVQTLLRSESQHRYHF